MGVELDVPSEPLLVRAPQKRRNFYQRRIAEIQRSLVILDEVKIAKIFCYLEETLEDRSCDNQGKGSGLERLSALLDSVLLLYDHLDFFILILLMCRSNFTEGMSLHKKCSIVAYFSVIQVK
jgi:hypothetical protein